MNVIQVNGHCLEKRNRVQVSTQMACIHYTQHSWKRHEPTLAIGKQDKLWSLALDCNQYNTNGVILNSTSFLVTKSLYLWKKLLWDLFYHVVLKRTSENRRSFLFIPVYPTCLNDARRAQCSTIFSFTKREKGHLKCFRPCDLLHKCRSI